jgi:hemolysin activation/secretion protein
VGNPRGLVNAAIDNIIGLGDSLDLTFGYSEGLTPLIDARYSLPITSRDTFLSFRYKLEDFKIVEKPFEALDIKTDVQRFEITVGHPFYRSLENDFSMALTGEYTTSSTTLLGEPFSLSPGTQDGEIDLAVLRFSQEWTSRAQRQAIAARSRLSFGLDAFGSTTNPEPLPDSQFFVWLGQLQWARVLGDTGIQLIYRTDLQLATETLPAVELISVGGRYSVRGYRENTLVTDNAVIASLESRIPLIRDRRWTDYLQLVPFFDFGHGWNTDIQNPSPETIYSVGLGLRWAATLTKHPNNIGARFEIYYGYQLKEVDYPLTEHNLQDEGISFRFVLSAS